MRRKTEKRQLHLHWGNSQRSPKGGTTAKPSVDNQNPTGAAPLGSGGKVESTRNKRKQTKCDSETTSETKATKSKKT